MSIPYKRVTTGKSAQIVLRAMDVKAFFMSSDKDVFIAVLNSSGKPDMAAALVQLYSSGRSFESLLEEYRCDQDNSLPSEKRRNDVSA